MALIKCSECQKEISSSAKVCPRCGFTNVIKVCPECNQIIDSNENACPTCGFPLHNKNVQNIISDNLDKITGARSEKYTSFKDLFKNTFSKHTEEEIEEIFICGGSNTTPDLKNIDPKKANAWLYFKILLFFIMAYIPVRIGFISYGNTNFLPAMIMLAAFAVPVTILMFFFEINIFRNIPFYKIIKYFILGGGLSLILAILFFSLDFNTNISTYFGALMVGLIEEVAKATIVTIFLFKCKNCNYILNGLLIGAAVGASFAAFETAGYILRFGLNNGLASMLNVIKLRGILAPEGHVARAAIEGAALMYVKGFEKLDKKHLNDKRFLFICLIPIILHGIWDMPISLPYYLLQISLTIIAWLVIIYFINLGLKQVDEVKEKENS